MATKKKTTKKAKKKDPVKKATKAAKKTKRGAGIASGTDLQQYGSNGLTVDIPGKLSATALDLPGDLEHGDWVTTLFKVAQIHDGSNWWIGDALNFGEGKFGEMYAQAASDTGIPEDRLMILKHVSLRVDPLTRIKELSWSHHREVAKLKPDEQSEWLQEALQKGWTVKELKDALRRKGHRSPNEDKDGDPKDICPNCNAEDATVKIGPKCLKKIVTQKENLSEPQKEMMAWAFEYIKEPEFEASLEGARRVDEWQAMFDRLKAAVKGKSAKKKSKKKETAAAV